MGRTDIRTDGVQSEMGLLERDWERLVASEVDERTNENSSVSRGLVVSAPDCTETTKVRISLRAVAFIAIATAICSLGHGLRTFTAVPRSTQPQHPSGHRCKNVQIKINKR